MRGRKKEQTLLKLDRERVLPFYITPEQAVLYEQDEFKYIIHLYRLFPEDEYNVIQYLLLRFHPLIIRVCSKYSKRKINLDWAELISFARYSFVELVMRFDLNSTLYFCTFIPLALDRAVNDYHIYEQRRHAINNAVRFDQVTTAEQDALIHEYHDIAGLSVADYSVADCKSECIHFVEAHPTLSILEKEIFHAYFIDNADIVSIATSKGVAQDTVRKRIQTVLSLVRAHIKDAFL